MKKSFDSLSNLIIIGSQAAFDKHYNGNRQPFGIYVHPSKLVYICQKKSIFLTLLFIYSSFNHLSWRSR